MAVFLVIRTGRLVRHGLASNLKVEAQYITFLEAEVFSLLFKEAGRVDLFSYKLFFSIEKFHILIFNLGIFLYLYK